MRSGLKRSKVLQTCVQIVDLVKSFQTSIYYLVATFGFDTARAAWIAEFVAVHIVLVKLSFAIAIKTSAIPRQMFLFSFIFSYPSGTFSFWG